MFGYKQPKNNNTYQNHPYGPSTEKGDYGCTQSHISLSRFSLCIYLLVSVPPCLCLSVTVSRCIYRSVCCISPYSLSLSRFSSLALACYRSRGASFTLINTDLQATGRLSGQMWTRCGLSTLDRQHAVSSTCVSCC